MGVWERLVLVSPGAFLDVDGPPRDPRDRPLTIVTLNLTREGEDSAVLLRQKWKNEDKRHAHNLTAFIPQARGEGGLFHPTSQRKVVERTCMHRKMWCRAGGYLPRSRTDAEIEFVVLSCVNVARTRRALPDQWLSCRLRISKLAEFHRVQLFNHELRSPVGA